MATGRESLIIFRNRHIRIFNQTREDLLEDHQFKDVIGIGLMVACLTFMFACFLYFLIMWISETYFNVNTNRWLFNGNQFQNPPAHQNRPNREIEEESSGFELQSMNENKPPPTYQSLFLEKIEEPPPNYQAAIDTNSQIIR